MGEAFAAGLKEIFPKIRMCVAEKVPARAAAARERFGAEDLTDKPEAFFGFSDTFLIAVKPQDALGAVEAAAPYSKDRRFITIVAGKTLKFYRERLDTPFIARFMPSLAAMYRKAAVGVSFLPDEKPSGKVLAFRKETLVMAEALGMPLEIPERLMPAVTGISGSGIAYVFAFVHALAMGGVKAGLGYDKALSIAIQVVEGGAEVLRKTGENPASLIAKVASPAGTTIEGLLALEEAAFTAGVMRAVESASVRAEELEN